jgi:hypothetical protein
MRDRAAGTYFMRGAHVRQRQQATTARCAAAPGHRRPKSPRCAFGHIRDVKIWVKRRRAAMRCARPRRGRCALRSRALTSPKSDEKMVSQRFVTALQPTYFMRSAHVRQRLRP